jgi:hypothetical protein
LATTCRTRAAYSGGTVAQKSQAAEVAVLEQSERETPVQSIGIAVLQMVVTWAVQRAMSSGYRTLTGREEPTARDATVPFRRVIVWAAASAAAVAVSNVAVDRLVLRR